jgi:hypothetical protein
LVLHQYTAQEKKPRQKKKKKFPSPSQASHEEHQRGLEIFPDFNLPYQHHLHPNRHYNSLLIKPATSPLKEINPDMKHHLSSLTNHQTISQPRHHPSNPFIRQKKKTPLLINLILNSIFKNLFDSIWYVCIRFDEL